MEQSLEGLRSLPPRQVAPLPQRLVYLRPSSSAEVPLGSGEPVPIAGTQTPTSPMSPYERAWAEWEHKKQLDAQARQQIHGVVQRMGWGTPPAEPSPPVLQAADLDPGLTRPRGIGFLTPEEARVANPLRPTLQRIQGKLDRGQSLEDWELHLFFGRLEGAKALLQGGAAESQVDRVIEWAHGRLDEIETSPQSARKNKDGYVILGDRAYGKGEKNLKQIARQTREHFLKTGHYPPSPFPKGIKGPDGEPIPPANTRWDKYDVTDRVNEELEKLAQKMHSLRVKQQFWEPAKIYDYFRRNFGDNGIHDFQVGHGLPGQASLYDPRTRSYLTDSNGVVLTIDEFAKFNEEVVKAGYISNYAYGYAVAAAKIPLHIAVGAAHGISLLKGLKLDNPEDIKAMVTGYLDYWETHEDEFPPYPIEGKYQGPFFEKLI